ncbi:hypothetical protein V9T40_006206 [Parthenolecanium corni]|uniref:Uncharacterized protein n=1 Tax=Parthenolecanium corni TaxID=536013 RepID=A0AAN9TXU1_9HEMI
MAGTPRSALRHERGVHGHAGLNSGSRKVVFFHRQLHCAELVPRTNASPAIRLLPLRLRLPQPPLHEFDFVALRSIIQSLSPAIANTCRTEDVPTPSQSLILSAVMPAKPSPCSPEQLP